MQPNAPGTITAWSGSIVDIPAGYQLCDGTNGTPDLRDKFIVGAGTTYSPSDTGGAVNHTHQATTDGHSHIAPSGFDMGTDPPLANPIYDTKTDTFTSDPGNNLPTYYALAKIMFLGA